MMYSLDVWLAFVMMFAAAVLGHLIGYWLGQRSVR